MTTFGVAEQRAVVTSTTMTLVSDAELPAVSAELRYVTHRPFAVQVVLSLGACPAVEWIFARDLLIQGVQAPAGEGDIHVYPASGGVVIELHSPDGDAVLMADAQALTDFANQTLAAVPAGREGEYYSIDAELATLMALVTDRPAES